MEIPDLVQQTLGDEEVRTAISLGDDDVACFTATRTLVYRGEGLLSDEAIGEYPHDFERLATSKGRRKTKFRLDYVDRTEDVTVANDRRAAILEQLLEGYLRVDGAIDADETATGVFQFSELTLFVTTGRLLKHVGEYTWDEDFEAFPFADVTGLSFEEGNVATAVVIEVDGRPERIKAPNDQAPHVRKTLEEALFEYYDVDSLEALNRTVEVEEETEPADGASESAAAAGGMDLGAGLDPLVGGDRSASEAGADNWEPLSEADAGSGDDGGQAQRSGREGARATEASDANGPGSTNASPASRSAASGDRLAGDPGPSSGGAATAEDVQAVTDQLADLTAAVEQQNELLAKQRRTIEQLIEELRGSR